MNSFGRLFRVTTFGESHGICIGAVIDGCPAGIKLNLDNISNWLKRRQGRSSVSTPRKEPDEVEFISGLFEARTTGVPLAFIIRNHDQQEQAYAQLRDCFRPSHADYTYQVKYGHRDHRGGGRASARETVVRVVAGAIAAQLLAEQGIEIIAYTTRVGRLCIPTRYIPEVNPEAVQHSAIGCPLPEYDQQMHSYAQQAREKGNTVGGQVTCLVKGVKAGLGSPLYDKLEARLAYALMSIGAAVGFEMGYGTSLAEQYGTDANDPWIQDSDGEIKTLTNHCGGIQGGITNGMPLCMTVSFKPIASVAIPQQTINRQGETCTISITGRHDACVIPRVLPVVEAMVALVLYDEWLHIR